MRKQLSNKINAQKSTGPKTVQGKFNSSKNALKHGAFAKIHIDVDVRDDNYFKILLRDTEKMFPSANHVVRIHHHLYATTLWKKHLLDQYWHDWRIAHELTFALHDFKEYSRDLSELRTNVKKHNQEFMDIDLALVDLRRRYLSDFFVFDNRGNPENEHKLSEDSFRMIYEQVDREILVNGVKEIKQKVLSHISETLPLELQNQVLDFTNDEVCYRKNIEIYFNEFCLLFEQKGSWHLPLFEFYKALLRRKKEILSEEMFLIEKKTDILSQYDERMNYLFSCEMQFQELSHQLVKEINKHYKSLKTLCNEYS